ncbi:aminoglycoside phosphotransferase family protein [Devosia nitrariae]|uniref:Streptomycin 6-kinase n=1 Tax=Devosia nitrariae TaxID=2071872 RepID=A0ABQ5W1P6_9HYPH|nr:aminoglycoside phosphotransferase family protein [Devosia nitrariae]GLQ53812.1 streptomycin 6-kinase [Devosia nitrariae]
MTGKVVIPVEVRQRAAAAGDVGRRWLDALPDLVVGLERDWGITVGDPFHGGSAGLVARATNAAGEAVVLKLGSPAHDNFASEVAVLRIAAGRGYANLLNYDAPRRAMLLERLGPILHELGLPIARRIEIICETLRQAWPPAPDPAGLQSAAQKARHLAGLIAKWQQQLGEPCSGRVVAQAMAFATDRESAFDPARAVILHGDAHDHNALQTLDGAGFKFVDPDPLFGERAYDIAISMRSWTDELLAGDPVRLGLDRCKQLADLTGEAPGAIWQWGFLERVSSGLFLLVLGRFDEGRRMLAVAETWAAVGA